MLPLPPRREPGGAQVCTIRRGNRIQSRDPRTARDCRVAADPLATMILSNPVLVRRLFDIGVIIKGIDGAIEAVAGCLLLFKADTLQTWIWMWIFHRPDEKSGDILARLLTHLADALSGDAKDFAVYYLVGHGVVKVFLAVNLLRERMWAFPVAIVFFGLFVVYQLHRYQLTNSLTLLGLALLDLVVIGLIWREWRLRAHGEPPPPPLRLPHLRDRTRH